MRDVTDAVPVVGTDAATGAAVEAAQGPMLRLLRKDLAALRLRHIGLIALIYVMAALQAVRSDEALFTLGVALALAFALAVPAIEWRLDTDRLLASLPVRRSTLVRARHAAAGMAVVAAWGAWVLTGSMLAPLLAPERTGPDSWATAEGNLAFLLLCVGILAVFLPLFFRLGLGRAATAFLPLTVALYGLAAAVAGAPNGGPALSPPGALIRSHVAALALEWGWLATTAAAAVALTGLVALSVSLSTRGFQRRDL